MLQLDDVRKLINRPDGFIVMYVGNLESYQGIDLLLDSFALVAQTNHLADLVIIGGEASDIQKYSRMAERLQMSHRVHFLGPKPVEHLSGYLTQADILVSPRIKGKNTPMKIYSYLGSGKAVVATNLETHTQVLTPQVAVLADPSADAFAQGILSLMESQALRQSLGAAGQQLIQENFSFTAFRDRVNNLLDWVQAQIATETVSAV